MRRFARQPRDAACKRRARAFWGLAVKFSLRRIVGEAVQTVRERIDREHVARMRERPWQDGQVLVEQPDGCAEAAYSVCHVGDLVQEVLRAAGLVEVLEPADVRERVRAAAERLMGKHG